MENCFIVIAQTPSMVINIRKRKEKSKRNKSETAHNHQRTFLKADPLEKKTSFAFSIE